MGFFQTFVSTHCIVLIWLQLFQKVYPEAYVFACVSVYCCLSRTPGKPGSSPRGQTPDEIGRRQGQNHEGNSSVSDLANSVTSDMLMVSHKVYIIICSSVRKCKLFFIDVFGLLSERFLHYCKRQPSAQHYVSFIIKVKCKLKIISKGKNKQ